MTHKNKLSILLSSFILLIISCNKNDFPPAPEPVQPAQGLYILNEGNFNKNDATLSYYDFATANVTNGIYASINNQQLGATANDAIIYGSKMYIVMNVSNEVTVVNKHTAKLIGKIKADSDWSPRYAAAYKNKMLITAFNNTLSIIDTTNLTTEKVIKVGANPEGLVVMGDMAYVVNSGGLNDKPDSTISIVDLKKGEEISKLVVGLNPYMIVAGNDGKLYVSTRSYWKDEKYIPKIIVIDSKTNQVIKTIDATGSKMAYYNNKIYTYNYDYTTQKATVVVIDSKTDNVLTNEFITDGKMAQLPYGLDIDESNGDVYIADAVDYVSPGMIHCYDQSGSKKFSFSLSPQGFWPNKVLFLR